MNQLKREIGVVNQKVVDVLGAQYTFTVLEPKKIVRSVRKEPPSHYLFQIDSFPSTVDSDPRGQHFDSTEFDAEGYKWVLAIYPRRKEDDDNDYISLYLKLVEKLDRGCSISAICKFFSYDYKRQIYLVIQALEAHRFDELENERGISRVLLLSDFINASNGFLVNGRCMFGVEVTILSTKAQTAGLRDLNVRPNSKYTWVMPNFSECLKHEHACSDQFIREGHSWKLEMHPGGHGRGMGKGLSLYLSLMDYSDLTNGRKLFAQIVLCLKNLKNEPDRAQTVNGCYTSSATSCGYDDIALLSDLHNPEKGFKLDDTVIVEVELKQLQLMTDNSSVTKEMSNYQG